MNTSIKMAVQSELEQVELSFGNLFSGHESVHFLATRIAIKDPSINTKYFHD